MTTAVFNGSLLPWEIAGAEDTRFRRILAIALGGLLAIAVAIPLLPLDTDTRAEKVDPPALTRVVLEKRELPEPPPPPPPEPVQEKPEPVPAVVPPPDPALSPEPAPEPDPEQLLAEARDTAAAAGVLAFRDDLAALRDSVDMAALSRTGTSRGADSAPELQRAVLTAGAATDSGGIRSASLSTDTGGPALSGRQAVAVHSNIAGTPREGAAGNSGGSHTGGRSDDAIRRVMDENKGAIFALYNRALRRDPLLEGKLVFEMVIHPDGSITELTMLSSGLADDELTRRLLARIQLIRFGADDVLSTRVNYSLDFLPYI